VRAPLFVYHRGVTWPRDAIRWLRCLGGKRGLRIDRDGPDVLLAGIRAVFVTAATRAFAAHHPFPAGHTSLWVITRCIVLTKRRRRVTLYSHWLIA